MTPQPANQPQDPQGARHVPAARARSRAHVGTASGEVVGEERERLALGFGRRLRALRRRMEWSQATLAHGATLSVHAVRSLELGRRRPEYGALVRLVRVLVPVEERAAVLEELVGLAGESLRRWNRERSPQLVTAREKRGGRNRRRPATPEERARLAERVAGLDAKIAAMRARSGLPSRRRRADQPPPDTVEPPL